MMLEAKEMKKSNRWCTRSDESIARPKTWIRTRGKGNPGWYVPGSQVE